MPPHHGVRLHDDQGGAPLPPSLGEENPKEAVPGAELWALNRPHDGVRVDDDQGERVNAANC